MITDKKANLLEMLQFVDPCQLNYGEWVNVGMALKQEGYSVNDFEEFSARDVGRYHAGESTKKWNSFNNNNGGSPVTGAFITVLAKNNGWTSSYIKREEKALAWDAVINDEQVIIQPAWLEGKEIMEPDANSWDPVHELTTYLQTLFDSTENVGYVVDSYEQDGKHAPKAGAFSRTAGELIQALNKCGGDIGSVLGDYDKDVGAWIRFNPLDGKGVKNENVTDFKYALVESDNMALDKQNAIIRELEMPVACLVYSGKKSIHAIVKIDAANYEEYRKRVDYLYGICQKNGLHVDTQNKNPSRLSRMPGVMRRGKMQFLMATNIGQANFNEWQEWIEAVNDNLPEPESLAGVWDNLPPLAPPLIHGLLRQGHKMLLAGPSKAGKSFALIELCCAIAEGKQWLTFECAKGKILYINLELDRASCLHRFKDVYQALKWDPSSIDNIEIWNLRGKSLPMDKLAPKLIRRAQKRNYIAIVVDPIYKIITGDENSADQMAHFCNQFDKICTELGCAVIYCHHHSKGSQGGKKSMDRASGSGVFARDPDALLDLIELETKATDDADINKTAWRIESTLREFAQFPPINVWFEYPIHKTDKGNFLSMAIAKGSEAPWQKGANKNKENAEFKQSQLSIAFDSTADNGKTTVKQLAEFYSATEKTIRNYIKKDEGFMVDMGIVTRVATDKQQPEQGEILQDFRGKRH